MIKETTLTGSAEEIQTRIRKLAAAGVNQVAIAEVAGSQNLMNEFTEYVVPALVRG
jgi:hypothetical protein